MKSRIMTIPHGLEFKGTTPDGKNGFTWKAKYGTVGVELLETDILAQADIEKHPVSLTVRILLAAKETFVHPVSCGTPPKYRRDAKSDEIVHITDMFTTLVRWGGAEIPQDRMIDGQDQRNFLEGEQEKSAREGFPYWMGPTLYGDKWHHYKMKLMNKRICGTREKTRHPSNHQLEDGPEGAHTR